MPVCEARGAPLLHLHLHLENRHPSAPRSLSSVILAKYLKYNQRNRTNLSNNYPQFFTFGLTFQRSVLSRKIEEGAAHLLELRNLIRNYNETERQVPLREPDLLLVLTGTDMAYTRPDGEKVVPIGYLRD